MARLGGLILVALGLASGWFALAGEYTVLMNPVFRWITVAGAGLLLGMGVVLTAKPARSSASALGIFALFLTLLALARPDLGGVAPLFAPPTGQMSIDRAGYEPFRALALFQTLDQEVSDIVRRRVAMRGFVKRIPALDSKGEFVLLEPLMACCLADVVAYGVRVRGADGALPEDGSWVCAFGDLQRNDTPVTTPSFRVGAILFTPVSRMYRLTDSEVVSYTALLEDLMGMISERYCGRFRVLATLAKLAETLREEGPFTVFVPHDAAFARMSKADRDALLEDGDRLRRTLEGWIVRGRHAKSDLYRLEALTTLSGSELPIRVENGTLRIGEARILSGAATARNGLLYVVHPLPIDVPAQR